MIPLLAPTLTIFHVIRTPNNVDIESLNEIGRWTERKFTPVLFHIFKFLRNLQSVVYMFTVYL